MASVGHIAVGLAAGRRYALPGATRLAAALVGLSLLSMLPDLDVVGFAFGVPYASQFGHRGATHSLIAAAIVAVFYSQVERQRGRPALRALVFATLVVASHGLLDAMTNGGLGVALLWPFSARRYFAPWRPIPVAPIGVRFLSSSGLRVALWETIVSAPLFAYGLWPRARR